MAPDTEIIWKSVRTFMVPCTILAMDQKYEFAATYDMSAKVLATGDGSVHLRRLMTCLRGSCNGSDVDI